MDYSLLLQAFSSVNFQTVLNVMGQTVSLAVTPFMCKYGATKIVNGFNYVMNKGELSSGYYSPNILEDLERNDLKSVRLYHGKKQTISHDDWEESFDRAYSTYYDPEVYGDSMSGRDDYYW